MKTTVDIDDAILHAAEDQARRQEKPLDVFIEEALLGTTESAESCNPAPPRSLVEDGLEHDDPFFAALEEIRESGRLQAPHRVS